MRKPSRNDSIASAPAALYRTERGKTLAEDVLAFVRDAWGVTVPRNIHLMCFGFPVPGLTDYVKSARTFALLTPSFIGPVPWREGGVNKSAVVDEAKLAVRAGCFDRALVFHTVEHLEDPVSFLEELWRVIAPGGRVIFLLPKGGATLSPFKFKSLLADKGFMPAALGGALFGIGGGPGKPKAAGLFRSLNPKSGLLGAAYFLIEADKRQDNFGAEKAPGVKAIRARPIPS